MNLPIGPMNKVKGDLIRYMNNKGDKSLIDLIYQASHILNIASLVIAGLLFIMTVLTVIFAVFSRYFWNTSFIWTDELARYSLIYFVLIAANAALKSDDHMKIDIAEKYFPDKINIVFKWVRRIIIVIVISMMISKGYEIAVDAWHKRTLGLGISRGIPLLSIPVGMTLFLIQYVLLQIIEVFKKEV